MALPTEDREFTIQGRVSNEQTGEFLEGVNCVLAGTSAKTDRQGRFTLKVMLAVDPETDQIRSLNTNVIYTKGQFAPKTQSILTGSNKVKSVLNNIALTDLPTSIQQEINKVQRQAEETIEQVKNSLPKDPTAALFRLINRAIQRLTSSLLPLLIRQLALFGISSLTQRAEKSCPNRDGMMQVIRQKNKATRELNNIFRRIATVTALAGVFLSLRSALSSARISLFSIPLPTTLGIPPGPAGGVIFSQPIGNTLTLDETVDKIKENENRFGNINRALLSAVLMLTIVIARIVRLNQQLDEIVNECSEELGEEFTSEALSEELIALATEEVEDGNPRTTNVNGFNLEVQVDDMAVGSLKRRFAVARDSNGVIVLRGEKSLSASDQILIDELAYYIQVNNLKA